MTLALLTIVAEFALLVWSADRFVEGAAATAKYAGMSGAIDWYIDRRVWRLGA